MAGTLQSAGGNNYTVAYTVAAGQTDVPDASNLPVSFTLYDPAGNQSYTYASSSPSTRPGVDANAPTNPGPLSFIAKTNTAITFGLGTSTVEASFKEYKIYYKPGGSGVSENDMLFASSSDPNLGYIDFNSATTTAVSGLATGTLYSFRVWAYDQAGNKASSTEITASTNHPSANPAGLGQFKPDGQSVISNNEWSNENTIELSAGANDADENEYVTLYFEVRAATGTLTAATSVPASPCLNGTAYSSCSSKIWSITSGPGDYSLAPFSATASVTALPENSSGYQWQVLACDKNAFCSNWSSYGASPNFRIDTVSPADPGPLSFYSKTSTSITLSFGTSTAEVNFSHYKIYYIVGSSGVVEGGLEHVDPGLNYIDYDNATTTTTTNLTAGTQYAFKIWAYDLAGNKASSTEVAITTNSASNPPESSFNSAAQRTDGSGVIEISIQIDDPDNNDTVAAKLEYTSGSACDFSSPQDPTLDEDPVSISATYGSPTADNGSEYQVGSTTGWILTSPGSNTVSFNWLSKADLPAANGIYCLRLTAYDGEFAQLNPATTTVLIDNLAPQTPGPLAENVKSAYSIKLNFGSTSSDDNFDRYRIFYKVGASGVAETDLEHDDPDLYSANYNNESSTTISSLTQGTAYVFNIWAYDIYGNRASSTQELAITTNCLPQNPAGIEQLKSDGLTAISQGGWTNEGSAELKASANDQNAGETISLYFEFKPVAGSFMTATTEPQDACAENESYSICTSKIWRVVSAPGDYGAIPFTGTVGPSAIPDSDAGYKWQVLACDSYGGCSDWTSPGAAPNFKVDKTPPTAPGSLFFSKKNYQSLTLNFGATTTEANFREYRVYYKPGTSGVSESDSLFATTSDPNLGYIDYSGKATTTISGLLEGQNYAFNIWACDQAGNKTPAALEFSTTTNSRPVGSIPLALQKTNGTGAAHIIINVSDADRDYSKAKLEYAAGASCDFPSSLKPTLDETDANATSTYGDAKILNSNAYQIGNSSGWINTLSGANVVSFDWLSKTDLPSGNGIYCLRLTANDLIDDQALPATTTVLIDNVNPTAPGDLYLVRSAGNSLVLHYGTSSAESNFKEYKIFYKEGVATVNENDLQLADPNLAYQNYNNAATTSASSLKANTQYSFKAYAYDNYGNKNSSGQTTFTTNGKPTGSFNSAAQKTDGSGIVDLSIEVNDTNGNDCTAKLEYAAGSSCDFSSPLDPTLNEATGTIQADYGTPGIKNSAAYQIGSTTKISTNSGSNTVNFDWLSAVDQPSAGGIYCLRLTVNDGVDDQDISATATVLIDNNKPSAPGDLTVENAEGLSITLRFGTSSAESNFSEYKIFYKTYSPEVTEQDMEFNKFDDAALGFLDFNGATTTEISGLVQNTPYYFNIWAYDDFGNTASATNEISTTTLTVPSATWRDIEDFPDPTAGEYLGKESNVRLRIALANTGDWDASNYQFQLQYAPKQGACSATSTWVTVPADPTSKHFEMVDSLYFDHGASTTARLANSEGYNFKPGCMIEDPYNISGNIILSGVDYTEIEYAIRATASSSAGSTYCFRVVNNGTVVDSYDVYPELTISPPASGSFNSAVQRNNGTGRIDISVKVEDLGKLPSTAKIEYAPGADCDFFLPQDPDLDESQANIQADYGNPQIDNSAAYQIGTSSSKIITQYGQNNLAFDWLSQPALDGQEGIYCLRLTVNNGYDDQQQPATTTLEIDNKAPTEPGTLIEESKTLNSVIIGFGATSSDQNFREYKIFYKEGASGVTESDLVHSSSSDPNLGYASFNGAATTTISGLTEGRQYVFRIWAYDNYGNKASSSGEITVKMVPTISGVVYQPDGLTPCYCPSKVSIAVNGLKQYSATTSPADGSYQFKDIDPPAVGTLLVVFLDDSSQVGATYFRYGVSGKITDLNIYENKVAVRHGDAGPVTVSDIDSYDGDQDGDIQTTVSGGVLSMAQGQEFYVWPGSEFETSGAEMNIDDLKIRGDFFAVGTQTISIAGDWDASGGSFIPASSTVRFTSNNSGNTILSNGSHFFNLIFDGAGDWTFLDTASTTATTTIMQGNLIQGGDNHFQTESLFIHEDAVFTKATGTGLLIFEGPREGTIEDQNTAKNDLGNVQIGYSPATTNLNSDFSASSLTVNSGDSINTRGFEVTVTSFITISGNYNCNDTKEGDGTITTLGTDWTVAPGANFTAANSTTTFAGTANSTINTGGIDASHAFYNLTFEKTAQATSTLNSYALSATGNVVIGANSGFDVSASSYNITIGGHWLNSGRFESRTSTTTFNSTRAYNRINAGQSPFYNAEFNNSSGGWTIVSNATSSNNWFLDSAANFTANSGVTIEVKGYFKNYISEAASSWSGSTLYLNNAANYEISSKSLDGPDFGNIRVGAGANISMWNSSAAACQFTDTSSLYSKDNGDADGSLYIWGNYENTGSEYWSYVKDFDGTDISSTPRACNVRIAANSTTTFSGATLEIIGLSEASTTIENQGSGSFAMEIIDGSLNAQYYSFKNLNANGLNISGAPSVYSLSYGDYELYANGGSLISLTASVLDANPAATTTGCRFATTTSAITGYNVKLTGTPVTGWSFTGHYGGFDGEENDSDPGDPRGYLTWDDSPDYNPASQNWKWFHDEENETPTYSAAPMNFAPNNFGQNNTAKLRIVFNELDGITGQNIKIRLQYSTYSDFSGDIHFVGENGSSTSIWNYGNGAGEDNSLVSSTTLPDAAAFGTYNKSGISASSFAHTANTPVEYEFILRNNGAASGTVYYFRGYAVYYSVYRNFEKPIAKNIGPYSYPSVTAGDGFVSLGISGLPAGTITEGVTTDIDTYPQSVSYGTISFDNPLEAAQRLEITTNAESGYRLFVKENGNMASGYGNIINPIAYPNENPGNWPTLADPSDFGYHSGDYSLSGTDPSRFLLDDRYAKFESTPKEIGYNPLPVVSDIFDFIFKINVSSKQEAGDYTSIIQYLAVPYY